MRSWMVRGGLLAGLMLPGCATYQSSPGPLYAAHPGYYPAPYYSPYPVPRSYYYDRGPRSFFTFSFGSGHHRHGHRHNHGRRHHRHHWHR